jgi:hypothetical protein
MQDPLATLVLTYGRHVMTEHNHVYADTPITQAMKGLSVVEIVLDLHERGLDVYADVVYELAALADAVEVAAKEGWLHGGCSPTDCRLAAIRWAFEGGKNDF